MPAVSSSDAQPERQVGGCAVPGNSAGGAERRARRIRTTLEGLSAGRVVGEVAVLGWIVVLALTRLPELFFGDQALNLLMGQVIAEGGAPYADLWDLKHPGIFFFFAAGGALFGFNEIGIHLFELFWMVGLAIAVRIAAGQYLQCRAAAMLAPVLTVGTYYAVTTSYHVTQTEAIIGLPLLISLAAAVAAIRPGCRHPVVWLFISGLSAGVVCLFKAPYLAVPLLFWIPIGRVWRRARGQSARAAIHEMAPALAAGVLLPISLTFMYLMMTTDVSLIWWTFVVHPREAATAGGVYAQRFIDGVWWFGRAFRVPLALAIVGLWARLRSDWRHPEVMTAGLMLWLAGGVLLIWMQVISWWPYHYLSLFVPAGLLAAQGIETLWRSATARVLPRRRALAAAVLLCAAALYARQVQPLFGLMSTVFGAKPSPFDAASMRIYHAGRNMRYADDLATTSFLREPRSHPGPIYIFGDPNLYLLAGRRPAIPLLAWGTSPPSGAWQQLVRDLEDAAPSYILVDRDGLQGIILYGPAGQGDVAVLDSMLHRRYRVLIANANRTWYVRRDLPARTSAGGR